MKRKPTAGHIVFSVYCGILIWLVLFKLAFSWEDIRYLRCDRVINLIPFYDKNPIGRLQIREMMLNFLAFVPFGMYLNMLEISWKKGILLGCAVSLGFELCQFAFRIGASDVTDLITNTVGTTVGVCTYMVASKLFPNKKKLDKTIHTVSVILLLIFFFMAALLLAANA